MSGPIQRIKVDDIKVSNLFPANNFEPQRIVCLFPTMTRC
jgi:hypothetical protein